MQRGSLQKTADGVKLIGHYKAEFKAPAPPGRFQVDDGTFAVIKAEIDSGCPLVFAGHYTHEPNAAGHVVLVYGYTEGAVTSIFVADPHRGSTRKSQMSFKDFCDSYRSWPFKFDEYVTTEPNEYANLRPLFDGIGG